MKEILLLLEGVTPDEISVGFLIWLMDIAEESGMDVSGVSVIRK